MGLRTLSQDLLTHAWFLGSLDGFWRILLRGEADAVNKHKGGMMMIYLMVINTVISFAPQRSRHRPTNLLPPFDFRLTDESEGSILKPE